MSNDKPLFELQFVTSNYISQTASQPTNMATTNSSSKHTSPSTDMAILDSNPHHTLLLTLSNNTYLDPITTHLYISTHLAFSELVSFTYKAFCYHVCYPGPDCFAIVLGFEILPVLFFAVCQLPEFLSVLWHLFLPHIQELFTCLLPLEKKNCHCICFC